MTGQALGQVVWDELKTLSKENMKGVAAHIEAAYLFLEEDLDAALAHAETASRRAGRVASAREALGTVHYAREEWGDALRELRTATRLAGTSHLLPLMADCQRGLGRPEKALELGESREASRLGAESLVEMAIVLSGAHRDLGELDQSVAMLATPAQRIKPTDPAAGRLWFAYAEALAELGRPEAEEWYGRAASVGETGEPPVPREDDGVFYDLEDFAPAEATAASGQGEQDADGRESEVPHEEPQESAPAPPDDAQGPHDPRVGGDEGPGSDDR
ncbi:hypothetical protein [Kytococcus sedentarius]|uniref:hypothetical protein n=1 Tax=Kytococcus sedentarius TaxID=1276 RepID=UPI00194EC2EB|nr:hypothetical protein [Kytococcus sedentarius]QRO87839.1 hypothetical protein I6J30_02365 [Kytococcus sedentarius]